MAKIVGIQKQEGVYEGHPYCNYSFTCQENFSDKIPNSYGCYSKVYKGKCEVLDQVLRDLKIDVKALLGQNVTFLFDERGKVIDINVG